MTGFKSKKTAALDEEGMYLVHQTEIKTQYPSEMYEREREQQIKAQALTQPVQTTQIKKEQNYLHLQNKRYPKR